MIPAELLPWADLCADAYDIAPDFAIGPVVRGLVRTAPSGGTAAIFPGTRPDHVADDLADLDIGPLDIDGRGHLAHDSLWRLGLLALPRLAVLARQGPLDLAGHSLGAAAAAAVATQLTMIGLEPRRLVLFGCPRTAVGTWQRDLLAYFGVPVVLVRHGGDVVTRVPGRVAPRPGECLSAYSLALKLASAVLPLDADWEPPASDEIQLGDGTRSLNVADHAMRPGYRAAIAAAAGA